MKSLLSFCAVLAAMMISFSAQARPVLNFTGAQGPPVNVHDYEWALPGSSALSVGFSFNRDDADNIRALMRSNLNRRLLLRIGETTVVTPVVKAVMEGESLEVSVTDKETLNAIRKELTEEAS